MGSRSSRYSSTSDSAADGVKGSGSRKGGGSGKRARGGGGSELPRALPTLHTQAVFDVTNLLDDSGVSGSLFATCADDNRVQLTDWHARRVVVGWEAHSRCVNRVARSNRGRRLVTCSRDTTVRVWDYSVDAPSGPLATLSGHSLNVAAAEFSPGVHSAVAYCRNCELRVCAWGGGE